jgi:hypothetical protein
LSIFFSLFSLPFLAGLHSDYISFLPSSSSSSAATVMSTTASVTEVAVGPTPGPATGGEPRTPEGVPEDVLVESEVELEVAPELVPEVVLKEIPMEGAMIAASATTPSPSRGASALSPPAPRIAAAVGVASVTGLEVVLGHPTPYAPDDIPLGEAVSTAHRALSQVQRVLCREGGDLTDERRRLQLWASMLKRMTTSERVAAWA